MDTSGSFGMDSEADFTSLENGRHLSDDIIDNTFQLLLTSSNKKDEVVDYVSPSVFNRFVRHIEGDPGMLFVDERKLFLRTTNFAVILFPLLFGQHWILVIYHKPMKSIVYFDSARTILRDQQTMDKISQYLAYLLPETSSSTRYMQRGWLQRDESSCGIYILYYAFCFLRCVTMHQTDFLTLDMKSRQQLKSALDKKKLTGIARLVYPKCQSGGATAHKSVKQFIQVNCVPLDDYLKSPSSYDSNPETELIKGMGETPNFISSLDCHDRQSPPFIESSSDRQSTPQPQLSPQPHQEKEKQKLIFRIRKERTNSDADSVASGSVLNYPQNNLNGDGASLPSNNRTSTSLNCGRRPIPPAMAKRIQMPYGPKRDISAVPTRNPPEFIDSNNTPKSEYSRRSQYPEAIGRPIASPNYIHNSAHHFNNSKEPSVHSSSSNQFNNHQNSLRNHSSFKRKDVNLEMEQRNKKTGTSKPASLDNSSTEKLASDLLKYLQDNGAENRPFCPIINSEVTIKIDSSFLSDSSNSDKKSIKDQGIQCEIVPNELFKMIKWQMVDGHVALVFN